MTSIIAGLVAALFVWALQFLANRGRPARAKGYRELRWPLGIRVLSLAMLPFAGFVVFAASQARPDQAIAATVIAICFVLGSVYLAVCVFLTRVWWTFEGIGMEVPFVRRRFVRWDDVEAGGYSAGLQAFYIRGHGTQIWYSPMQSGIAQLHRFIGRKLNPIAPPHGPGAPASRAR